MFISERAVMSLHVCGLAPGVTLPKSGEVTQLKAINASSSSSFNNYSKKLILKTTKILKKCLLLTEN